MINNNCSNEHNLSREVFIEINLANMITHISDNSFNILGYKKYELLSKHISNYMDFMPENIKTNMNFESSFSLKDGTTIFIDAVISPIYEKNILYGYKLSFIDISKYKRINLNEKKMLDMLRRSKDIIYRIDVYPEHKMTYLSPSVGDVLGYSLEEYFNNPLLPFEIVHDDYKEFNLGKLDRDFDFVAPTAVPYKHKDGHYIWLEDFSIPIYDETGRYIAFEGIVRDVTKRVQLEFKLEELSYIDALTGLHNRSYLEREMNILDTVKDTSIGIIFCDLDNLKVTNDVFGHKFGDKLIMQTATIFNSIFKDNCVVTRTGGDEFVIIVKDTDIYEVENFYHKLLELIEKQNNHSNEFTIRVSVGYSYSETSIGVVRDVLEIADKNMYTNKQQKKLLHNI